MNYEYLYTKIRYEEDGDDLDDNDNDNVNNNNNAEKKGEIRRGEGSNRTISKSSACLPKISLALFQDLNVSGAGVGFASHFAHSPCFYY